MNIKDIFQRNKGQEQPTQPTQDDDQMRQVAQRAINDLSMLQEQGKLNRNIEDYIKSEDFIKLLFEFETYAAVRIFEAEEGTKEAKKQGREGLLEDINRRRELPRAIRSEAPASSQTDFSKMSSADFEKFKAQLKK